MIVRQHMASTALCVCDCFARTSERTDLFPLQIANGLPVTSSVLPSTLATPAPLPSGSMAPNSVEYAFFSLTLFFLQHQLQRQFSPSKRRYIQVFQTPTA
jgi:hypothetical protein